MVGKQLGMVVHLALHFSLIQKCSPGSLNSPVEIVLRVELVLSRQPPWMRGEVLRAFAPKYLAVAGLPLCLAL